MKLVARAMSVPASMKKPADVVAVELCERFVESGMLKDDKDFYGQPFIFATGPQYVTDICAVLREYLYVTTVKTDVFDAVCNLVVMGDGDCPECGGDLQFIETEGHDEPSGNYDVPPSYEIDRYVYKCTVCGETIKSEKEL